MPYLISTLFHSVPKTIEVASLEWGRRGTPREESERQFKAVMAGFKLGKRRLTQEEIPGGLVLTNGGKKAREYDNGWIKAPDGAIVVRDDFKRLIEEMDPGLHQFLDIPVTYRDGQRIMGDWYVLVVTVRQNSLDVERTPYLKDVANSEEKRIGLASEVVLDDSELAGINIWREELIRGEIFVSDRFKQAIDAAGIKFCKLVKVKSSKRRATQGAH